MLLKCHIYVSKKQKSYRTFYLTSSTTLIFSWNWYATLQLWHYRLSGVINPLSFLASHFCCSILHKTCLLRAIFAVCDIKTCAQSRKFVSCTSCVSRLIVIEMAMKTDVMFMSAVGAAGHVLRGLCARRPQQGPAAPVPGRAGRSPSQGAPGARDRRRAAAGAART